MLVHQKYHIEITILRNISKYEEKFFMAMKALCYRTDWHSDLVSGIIHSWSSWKCVLAKMVILAMDLEDIKNIL